MAYPINPEQGVPSGMSEFAREKLGRKAREKVSNDSAWLSKSFKPPELGSKMNA